MLPRVCPRVVVLSGKSFPVTALPTTTVVGEGELVPRWFPMVTIQYLTVSKWQRNLCRRPRSSVCCIAGALWLMYLDGNAAYPVRAMARPDGFVARSLDACGESVSQGQGLLGLGLWVPRERTRAPNGT